MKTRYEKYSETPETVEVTGSFAPNGSSAIVAANNLGAGFTVAYTSTGLYTITFTEKYKTLEAFVFGLRQVTAGDQFLQAGVYVAPTSTAKATITITNWDVSGNAAADLAADANTRISFTATFAVRSKLK